PLPPPNKPAPPLPPAPLSNKPADSPGCPPGAFMLVFGIAVGGGLMVVVPPNVCAPPPAPIVKLKFDPGTTVYIRLLYAPPPPPPAAPPIVLPPPPPPPQISTVIDVTPAGTVHGEVGLVTTVWAYKS